MKILDITAKNILENFQTAYFNQINRRMIIGSEEFTLSSIFSYALESFTGLLNKAYKNAFTATAEGKYLDNLAARYDLTRQMNQWTNPFFDIQFTCNQQSLVKDYEIGSVSMTIAGEVYTNSTKVIKSGVDQMSCSMRADSRHNNYISAEELRTLITEANLNGTIATITNINIAGKGLQQCGRILDSDEDFRDYIQASKYIYQSGVKSSFESVARAYADFIIDAKCATQEETGYYTKGIVDLYIKPDVVEHQVLRAVGVSTLTDTLKDIMSGNPLNTLVIGQTLRVHVADRFQPPTRHISVKVSPRLKGFTFSLSDGQTLSVEQLCYLKLDALMHYYNQRKLGIGESLYWNEFQQDFVNPLSALSDRPSDFGTAISDVLWNEALKDFSLEGITQGTTGMYVIGSENLKSYIHLSSGSVVIDEISYTVDEL